MVHWIGIRVEFDEALDELRRAAGLGAHRGSSERRGLASDAEGEIEEDTQREPVNPIRDIPMGYEEEIPFRHYGGPASAPRPRSWIRIMMRFVGVAAVAAVVALLVGKLVSPWNLATNGQLDKRPSAASSSRSPRNRKASTGQLPRPSIRRRLPRNTLSTSSCRSGPARIHL